MAIPKYKDPITGKWTRITTYGQSGNAVEITEISGETALSDDIITELKNDLNWIAYGGGAYRFVSAEEDKRLYSYITEDKISQILVNTLTKTCILRETQITSASVADSIVKRDSYGEIPVSTPSRDSSATNKAYVDEADKDLRLKLSNLEQALNGYILDTTKEAYADLDSAVLKDSVAGGDNVYPIADKTRALVTRIEGKTTKMVQLLDKSTFPATITDHGITFTNNGDGTITVNGTATAVASYFIPNFRMVLGHKYLLVGCPSGGSFGYGYTHSIHQTDPSGKKEYWADDGEGKIFTSVATTGIWVLAVYTASPTVDNKLFKPNLFDLTAMNREDITTVEQFKAEFPDLYPYENGNIYPAKISGVKFTGKNLWTCNKTNVFYEYDKTTQIYTINSIGSESCYKLPSPMPAGETFTISVKCLSGKIPDNATVTIGGYHRVAGESNSWQICVTLPREDVAGRTFTETGMTTNTLTDFWIFVDAAAAVSNLRFMVQYEAGSHATAYEPYIEPVSVTLPETYELHGIDDYKDYLEITKNEDNELYTLKKVQVIEKVILNGTENWNPYQYGDKPYTNVCYSIPLNPKFIKWTYRGTMMNLLNKLPTVIIDEKGYGAGDESATLYVRLPNIATAADMKAHVLSMYEAGTPYIFYGAIATPVETVIATNLTYEQVAAIRHNGGLIEVNGNTNKGYARPTVTNTIVYRLTAANTAEG